MKILHTISAVVILFLLLLMILLRILLGASKAFFLIANIEVSTIFSAFIIFILQFTLNVTSICGVIKLVIFCTILVVFIVTIAIVSCIRLGCSTTFSIFIVADILLFVLLSCGYLCYRRRYRRRNQWRHVQSPLQIITAREQELHLDYSYLRHIAGLPKNFRYEELSAATNNFQNQVGRGGSGSVFRGVLSDGSQIAVKRIEGEVRGEREFWNELVAIATVQHFNLVRLLGCCHIPGDNLRYLVYEFIENGSLDSWLFKKNNREEQEGDEVFLTWPLRYY